MKKRIALFFLCTALLISALPVFFATSAATASDHMLQLFEAKVFTASDGLKLNYRIYIPEDYDEDKSYPLILFMHGAGERGSDNQTQLATGISSSFSNFNSRIYDCIVIAPQCPLDKKWVNVTTWNDCNYSTDAIPETPELKAVVELFLQTQEDYSVDRDRVYATGLSMGGFATWDLAVRHPDLFAAIIPVCGGGDNRKAELLADLPIWTFHGDADPTVPIDGTTNMVNSLKAAGNTKVKYNIIQGGAHNIWPDVYSNEAIYMWLLTQKLSNRASVKDDQVTEPPAETEAPPVTESFDGDTTESAPPASVDEKGCQSSVCGIFPIFVVATGAFLVRKKKRIAR